jgi:hypothetical protein
MLWAISFIVRFLVPLNTMCSMKCEMPFFAGNSFREPVSIQKPSERERTCGIASVITRTPFGRVVFWYVDSVLVEDDECNRLNVFSFAF